MAKAQAICWAPTCAMHRASWMSQMQKVASADMEARYRPLACRDRSVTASVCCVRVLCRGKAKLRQSDGLHQQALQGPVRSAVSCEGEWQGMQEESLNAAAAQP